MEGNSLLSERQMEVLRAAWDEGWYDIPRQITLGDLSKKLGLGRSTVSEHLVRSEGTIIDYFLHGDPTLFEDIGDSD
jgi:predicted DNA binding protein